MIKVFEPDITLSDCFSVLKSLFSKNISGSSSSVSEFEVELAKKFQRKYAIATTSGSSALDVAFELLNLKKNDEVIIPSFTIISCLSAVIRSGAKPVFCDVDINSWNMTLHNIQNKFTQNTKAVLMVHTYGLTAEATKIAKFCSDNNIFLVEDAAEAHGQIVDGKYCGSFGHISTFSFYANKHLTTGEGGAILTDIEYYSKKANQLINLDFTKENRFQHDNLYWNYRLSGIQSALGLSQINKLEKVIRKKIKQGNFYRTLLDAHQDKIILQPSSINETYHHYWVFGILLKQNGIRDKLIKLLADEGIECRPFFWPLHMQKALPDKFKDVNEYLPVSENLGKNGFYIPLGSHVTKKLQTKIVDEIIKAIQTLSE